MAKKKENPDSLVVKEYKRKKSELLKRIDELNQVTCPLGDEKDDELERLYADYNLIAEQIEGENSSPLSDPLRCLPAELWQDIILSTRERQPLFSGPSPCSIDQIIEFTLVSKDWKQSILSTPVFWTNIEIVSGANDLLAKVVICLSLSGDLPLDVVFDVTLPIYDQLLPLIAPESRRVQAISLDAGQLWNNSCPDYTGLIMEALNDLQSLKYFRSSIDKNYIPQMVTLFEKATSIYSLSSVYSSTKILGVRSMKKLKVLSTRYPLELISSYLQDFESLEDVIFHGTGAYEHPETESIEFGKIRMDPKRNSLPWRTLVVWQNPTASVQRLIRMVSSTLVSLKFSILWGMVTEFIQILDQMPKLEDLEIHLPDHSNHAINISHNGLNISQIRNLTIQLDNNLNLVSGDQFEAGRDTNEVKKCIEVLSQTFTSLAPRVQKLHLLITVGHAAPLLYAESLQYLTEILVGFMLIESDECGRVNLPQVELIQLPGMTDVSTFRCPAALHLSVNNYFGVIPYNAMSLDPEAWSNLRILEVGGPLLTWENISLPRVEEIAIGRSYGPEEDGMASPLLEELALRQTSFPSLRRLKLKRFPEWDILFIMLERRNFLPPDGISKITSITLPYKPAFSIFRPLVQRLRGRLSMRPSNYELSIYSAASIYFDQNVPGCKRCHRAFQFCDMITANYLGYEKDFDLQLPPYPNTPEDILLTYRVRIEAWHEALRRLTIDRYELCDYFSWFSSLEVTANTPTDL